MALETKLALKTTQKLVMTATLQQAIKLLPLSRLELVQKIQQELLENPFLEELIAQEDLTASTQEAEAAQDREEAKNDEFETNWEVYLQENRSGTPYPIDQGREVPSLEATLKDETSLTEYLLWQLTLSINDAQDKQLGAYLIGNIDDNGYLQCPLSEVATTFDVPEADVERVLQTIQNFDPSGVGARDLQECLLIQLRHLGLEDSLASRIIQKYLLQLEERHFTRIAKAFEVSIEEVLLALKTIRELDPQPGSRYDAHRVEYITPDVFIVKIGDDFQVFLNDEGMPRLNINPLYQGILQQEKGVRNEAKEYMEEKLRSAVWLIKSVEQRRQTLLKVAKSLCKFQHDFLEKGLAYLKPLVLKDVAEDIGMHESTVSRVTTNKYVHTPQGVFELKFFFHSGLESFGGDALSSVSVKDIIRKAVAAEDARNPLTDQQLVELLEEQDIKIARRTVAKYRQELRISPANRRKRLFLS